MSELIGTFFDWLPLIVLVGFVVLFVRPITIARLLVRYALARGREDRAMSIATRYARMRPSDPDGWFTWTWLIARTGTRWTTSGVLTEGFAHRPDSLELGCELAEALMQEGRETEAFELLEELRNRHPTEPRPLLLMARLAVYADNSTEGHRLLQGCCELFNPKKHQGFAHEVAATLAYLGRPDEAQTLLETVEGNSFESINHLFLAVLKESSDPAAARCHLARARYYWTGARTDLAELFRSARELLR